MGVAWGDLISYFNMLREQCSFFPSLFTTELTVRHSAMKTLLGSVASSLLSLLFVLCVVAVAWYLLWTFVVSPNPMVRDFFDLDKVDTVVEQKKEK